MPSAIVALLGQSHSRKDGCVCRDAATNEGGERGDYGRKKGFQAAKDFDSRWGRRRTGSTQAVKRPGPVPSLSALHRKTYAFLARARPIDVAAGVRPRKYLKNCALFLAKCGESAAAILRECAQENSAFPLVPCGQTSYFVRSSAELTSTTTRPPPHSSARIYCFHREHNFFARPAFEGVETLPAVSTNLNVFLTYENLAAALRASDALAVLTGKNPDGLAMKL